MASDATAAPECISSVGCSRLAVSRTQEASGSKPIPDVAAAVSSARRTRLPKAIAHRCKLSRENAYISYGMRHGCQPGFGPGTTKRSLPARGHAHQSDVVGLIGDSHAGCGCRALEADGRPQGFAVVPLDKPGCVLNVIHENLPGWPCANWYRWALTAGPRLHPFATIVAFQLTRVCWPTEHDERRLQAVLGQVTTACCSPTPRAAFTTLLVHLPTGCDHESSRRTSAKHVRAADGGWQR